MLSDDGENGLRDEKIERSKEWERAEKNCVSSTAAFHAREKKNDWYLGSLIVSDTGLQERKTEEHRENSKKSANSKFIYRAQRNTTADAKEGEGRRNMA